MFYDVFLQELVCDEARTKYEVSVEGPIFTSASPTLHVHVATEHPQGTSIYVLCILCIIQRGEFMGCEWGEHTP